MNAIRWNRLLIVGALLLVATCSKGGERFKTPLVRVDLSSKLPTKQRRLSMTAIPWECKKTVALPSSGIEARFDVHWRVLDFGKARYVVAVEVRAAGSGTIEGVSGLSGSAGVGEVVNVGQPDAVIGAVPLHIGWSARKGCSELQAGKQIQLRADDKACRKPKMPKLLRPVK